MLLKKVTNTFDTFKLSHPFPHVKQKIAAKQKKLHYFKKFSEQNRTTVVTTTMSITATTVTDGTTDTDRTNLTDETNDISDTTRKSRKSSTAAKTVADPTIATVLNQDLLNKIDKSQTPNNLTIAVPSEDNPYKLTEGQLRFVAEYRKDRNATQAAIRAGYSKKSASQQGSALLKHPKVRAELTRQDHAQDAQTASEAEQARLWAIEKSRALYERAIEAGNLAAAASALTLYSRQHGLLRDTVVTEDVKSVEISDNIRKAAQELAALAIKRKYLKSDVIEEEPPRLPPKGAGADGGG